ncbi:MAG: HD domain-containing protein [Deltaproteobacteria bacterium]|nr:HD domain-containing protein [Deltaproteobacteria bacterium]
MVDELYSGDLVAKLLGIMEGLYHLEDLDALLDQVLLQARRLTAADAGSIYLKAHQVLHFSYVHNDTLFSPAGSHKYVYASHTLPLDNQSLAGYVALTGESLIIDDAYRIPPALPFTFNKSFDEKSGYRTRSLLAVPLKTSREKIVGVLEVINALGEQGEVVPFTEKDRLILNYFAANAGAAIERARLTREVILRMIKMCELRDPEETGAHANRVGAYAAEIYHRWSLNQGLPPEEIKINQDLLRIAAMLHDVGKIAISDLILKKPTGLDLEEFTVMKFHTILGARLFQNPDSDLDVMSGEIALNHHERWDGSGYPGKIEDICRDQIRLGEGKRGEEIPIGARIVALADVYDALGTKRSYKDPLPEAEILEHIREQTGRHFDPEVVRAFLEIYDVIVAIKEKYQEEPPTSLFCSLTL